ncbi:methyltransferase type 12 [Prosthecochloris sp. GSB1]|uniref:class I SAM-dependent methyltransferase n=1 Tax=Prosthecochloris sp. GSB1 TaxID=281093 RepID=UPI000B8C97C3|nr:methyltransferase domain-containing protein [Prosthecochloris sp. GSB1]ASQ91733.1 methyltransferase type 12 [Prosthecochloris sp. GSB1]
MTDTERSIDELYGALSGEYELQTVSYTIASQPFSFVSVNDSYALLDRISPEDFVRDEQMPYWAEIWPAALTLSEFVAEEIDVEGRRLVEIGAGVGMVSVAAARAGGNVLSTDYSGEALRFVRLNAFLNAVALETAKLDWRCIQLGERFDIMLAADVLYERVNLLPIVNALDILLKPGGCAYIADPRRRLAEQFLELAFENGFSVQTFAKSNVRDGQSIAVNIYRLSKQVAADE